MRKTKKKAGTEIKMEAIEKEKQSTANSNTVMRKEWKAAATPTYNALSIPDFREYHKRLMRS